MRFRFFPALLVCGAFVLASCSDSDDNDYTFGGETDDGVPTVDLIDPAKVFTGRKPISVAGMNISYFDNGLVRQIMGSRMGENDIVSFSYPALGRTVSDGKLVRMDVVSGDDYHQFNLRIGQNGFVDYAEEVSYEIDSPQDRERCYWWFSYSDDGHLLKMRRTDDDNEVVSLTYSGNDIMSVSVKNDKGEQELVDVRYGTVPIENIGGLMLFDEVYDIDIDEMVYAYYAGLLGMPSAHLPVEVTETEGRQTKTVRFDWTIGADGYPVSMKSSDEHVPFLFTWDK